MGCSQQSLPRSGLVKLVSVIIVCATILVVLREAARKQEYRATKIEDLNADLLLLSKEMRPNSVDVGTESQNITESLQPPQPRILCMILTGPKNHYTKAIHVKRTWGSRCDKLLFASSEADESLGAIGLPNVTEGHDKLWPKTKEGFKYVWERHRDEFDWFYKADDDTYAIVEHLRIFLEGYNSSEPHFFGETTHYRDVPQAAVNLGGPGYVLSREALRRFVQEAILDDRNCGHGYKGDEDTLISICLANVGVKAENSKDHLGRGRFFTHSPEYYFEEYAERNESVYVPEKDMNRVSDSVISFHYVNPKMMYTFELMLYHLQLHRSKNES